MTFKIHNCEGDHYQEFVERIERIRSGPRLAPSGRRPATVYVLTHEHEERRSALGAYPTSDAARAAVPANDTSRRVGEWRWISDSEWWAPSTDGSYTVLAFEVEEKAA